MPDQNPDRNGLAVCTPCGLYASPVGGKRLPLVTMDWVRARMGLEIPPGFDVAEIRVDGFEIGKARCMAAEEALRRGVKYLFFLDYDVLCPSATLRRLVYLLENNPSVDVASGVYCLKHDPAEPLIWREWGRGVSYDWTLGDVLSDCVGLPTGCMLIRVSVFNRLSHESPWFLTHDGLEGDMNSAQQTHMTDDIWFCKRLRAELPQSEILCDTGILCGHIENTTGAVYTLAEDALPMKRYRAKLAAQEAAAC